MGDLASMLGMNAPRGFVVDASILDDAEITEIVKEDVMRNRIEFVFPDGVNTLDLREECRSLAHLDDFDTMFDVTMQMLVGKPVEIHIKNYDGSKVTACQFQVVSVEQNLRGVDFIAEYPVVITWLTEFIGGVLSKKFPTPGKGVLSSTVSNKKKDNKRAKTAPQTS